MILELHHETRLAYSNPVIESVTEVRMEPASDQHQSVRSFRLSTNPTAEVSRYSDGFGNRVHHFNILPSCQEIRIIAASTVETHPQPRDAWVTPACFPLDRNTLEPESLGFINMGGPVRRTPRLDELVETLRPAAGVPIAELALQMSAYINEQFEYAKYVTLASSPVDDVLKQGKGVCQDFTHLMIALLRSFDVPSRYVSGYIHRPNKESQSHAWCEVWLPGLGWYGVDPTNNREVNDHFVKVAVGRDFTDVQPNKGVYRGKAQEEIFVRVESRALDRLPSISWQDAPPTFEVPLTSIASRTCAQEANYGDSAHQQQQQQQ